MLDKKPLGPSAHYVRLVTSCLCSFLPSGGGGVHMCSSTGRKMRMNHSGMVLFDQIQSSRYRWRRGSFTLHRTCVQRSMLYTNTNSTAHIRHTWTRADACTRVRQTCIQKHACTHRMNPRKGSVRLSSPLHCRLFKAAEESHATHTQCLFLPLRKSLLFVLIWPADPWMPSPTGSSASKRRKSQQRGGRREET